jgi:predicted DNA binding CopG/RHH family protein
MKAEYDFSKARPNPYAKQLRRSVTIRLDTFTLEYFQELAAELEMPYQTLINLYLRDCVATGRRPAMKWRPSKRGAA